MDDYPGKRAGDRLIISRKGSALVLRDTANNRDRNAQFCNRIGCSGRLNSTKGIPVRFSEKAKSSRPSFQSSTSGKEIIVSSSRTSSAISDHRKSLPEPQKKLSSRLETDSSENGSLQDEPDAPDLISPPSKIQIGLHLDSDDTGSSNTASMEAGSSSIATSEKSHRTFRRKSGLGSSDTQRISPVSLATKSTTHGTPANASRYGLRNLKCNSISDVGPLGSSSSGSNLSRRKDMVKKRICDGESSSSAGGKKMGSSSLKGRNSSSNSGISISDTRRARSGPLNRDNSVASVRTRRSLDGYTRARVANQGTVNNLSPHECLVVIPEISQPEIPIDLNAPSSSHQFSVGTSLTRSSSYSRHGTNNESLQGIRASNPTEVGNSRSLLNRESFRRHNMDGIAEVLYALERIEQDEELTYEQLLILETNLFLNGLNFYDEHRDMRLDIDNMSYEDLLALEERIGTVSTALTEEALIECLKISTYQPALLEDPMKNLDGWHNKDDIKCSICQEEYADGDEVGRLQCEHRYHVVCIHQWLRLKNWCPICKVSAAQSSSPPSSS